MKSSLFIIICILFLSGFCASVGDAVEGTVETRGYGSSTEMHLPVDEPVQSWTIDSAGFEERQGDELVQEISVKQEYRTVKKSDVVPDIHFSDGGVTIPADYVVQLEKALDEVRREKNVRLHFIGHTDSRPLRDHLKALFEDNTGLSRERAGAVAAHCKERLLIAPESITFEGRADTEPVASNSTEQGRAANRRVEVELWYDVPVDVAVTEDVFIPKNVARVKVCRTETVCQFKFKEGHVRRSSLRNLVRPLHYQVESLKIDEHFIDEIIKARQNLGNKRNLQIKFVAYTDDKPLPPREQRIYGDQTIFTKAIARRVARLVADRLADDTVTYVSEGRGSSGPLATNTTTHGRLLNRRVKVEFWYDDPLQILPDEPQICPQQGNQEVVARVHKSDFGPSPVIEFTQGAPVVTRQQLDFLKNLLAEISDKPNPRLRFVGYTANRVLSRRNAAIYLDDIGWSTARALKVRSVVAEQLGLDFSQTEVEGRGYLQTEDVVVSGFTEADTSRVEVQAVYDVALPSGDYEGVTITPFQREVEIKNPYGLNTMRITVDGEPVADVGRSSADVQRCTDVALNSTHVEFKHDSLLQDRRLNISAWPRSVRFSNHPDTFYQDNLVQFQMYTNYLPFIHRAEVRIFKESQAESDIPFTVIALGETGKGSWLVEYPEYAAPVETFKYLVRVYDENCDYDETKSQPLWVVDQLGAEAVQADAEQELLVGYGASRLKVSNIPLSGGTVSVAGAEVPEGYQVWLAGYPVPVAADGKFVAETILPEGLHTVEVAILDQDGNGDLYLRDLELQESDWFSIGFADITGSANETNGPAKLLDPDNPRYSEDFSLQGRLAFYTHGKFDNGWSLTASADTREGPLDEIFSNFMEKTSDAQLRRIDPDYHYPTMGDDSTVVETAPTKGKFYTRLEKDESFAMWGNFKLVYSDTELAQIHRQLYGANLHHQSSTMTSFGEPVFYVDGFAADPGTISARDDFRGTGGSLFYLQQQDVLSGSESLRIEIRDDDSGIVLASKSLTEGLDYDIDYLQGRILLTEVLPTSASDDYLVSTSSLSGNPVYLVARYEYTPGFDELDTMVTGGRMHYWLNDHVKIGGTASWGEEENVDSTLGAGDITLRATSSTWIKLEGGITSGPPEDTTTSYDGGYSSTTATTVTDENISASGYRVEGALGFADIFASSRGRSTYYFQHLDAGYSSQGEYSENDLDQYGANVNFPFGQRWLTQLKFDVADEDLGLETQAGEVNVNYNLSDHWTLTTAVRTDKRTDHSLVVADTQEQGERSDVAAKIHYDSRKDWAAYLFGQETLRRTGNRDDNGRIGVGGSVRLTDRFKISTEVSSGDLGAGGSLGTEYLYSDRTTLYSTYTLNSDREDDGVLERKGNFTSGFNTRYSDSVSLYAEEQYQHGDRPTGLIHTAGVSLVPTDRFNFSASADYGTLKDPDTSAEIERRAMAVSAGYGFENLALASALEYRVDNTEQSDSSYSERTSWLFKNSLKYQINPSWRMFAKFNYSTSESSSGSSYSSDYTEAIFGYAYRPVNHDRLNLLFKYTYFYNLPGSDATSTSSDTDYVQRSHIVAVDATYDLTPRWTVGGKYAYRLGQVALDTDDPEYFDSRASLYIGRLDWHFIKRWDAMAEFRLLDLPDAQDSRSGVLMALYRHLGDHIKVGAGYNFTDFSDDLTELSFKHQGFFVNVIGKL